MRRVLNQVAWRAIKKDQDLQELFERLYPKTGQKKAIAQRQASPDRSCVSEVDWSN